MDPRGTPHLNKLNIWLCSQTKQTTTDLIDQTYAIVYDIGQSVVGKFPHPNSDSDWNRNIKKKNVT